RLVYAIGEVDAPAPPRETMQFLASATRSPYIWTPPRTALGKWVWYCAAWETPRGALGAWSDYARAMGG
ncbi:MAG: hypothetical protein NZM28_03080, partial [Fimbriimonadales bacterium]|nr:hypothetical protein [Fimbriimonadales bacterium]